MSHAASFLQAGALFALGFFGIVGTAAVRADESAADRFFVYVSAGGDNALLIFQMDPQSGALTARGKLDVGGAPGSLTVDRQQKFLYAAIRNLASVATLVIDPKTGSLSPLGLVPVAADPVYLAIDKNGRYLLTSYYAAGKAAIYPIEKQGTINSQATVVLSTEKNPHSIQADPANRFVYVPNTGADKVLVYRFDEATGGLTPAAKPEFLLDSATGPRHFHFHPTSGRVYFVNEKGSSVTACDRDAATGSLAAIQTISTLPKEFQGSNTCAHIETTPDGKYLYASNRGHDSIAMFAVDPTTGRLTSLGQQPTEKTPRAFNIDPTGKYLLSAGQGSGQLATYRINASSGRLEPLAVYPAGKSPAWVLVLKLGAN